MAKALPDQWVKPIADAVILPLHAFVSGGPFDAHIRVSPTDTDADFPPVTLGVGMHTLGDGTDDALANDDNFDDVDDVDSGVDEPDDPDDDIGFLISGKRSGRRGRRLRH